MLSTPNRASVAPDFFDDPDSPWLLLSHLPGIGANRWQAIIDHLPDPLELLSLNAATLKSIGLPPPARASILAWQQHDLQQDTLQQANTTWQKVREQGIELVHWGHGDYPSLLREIHAAPPLLYMRGQREILSQPQLAIVGSRNASRAGLDHARQFARALAERGFVITSGLALGVDGAAHRGALDAAGRTLAVLGTGVDVAYPAAHQSLVQEILVNGALISEYPPGLPPRPGHFPRRNRIISGMSRGTLVVEASLRSGSLITARLALEQGREVFAIPGSIHNPLARGCHQLIRQGASLVESVADIEEELSAWWQADTDPPENSTTPAPPPQPEIPEHLEARERQVLETLDFDPCSTDELCDRSGLSADALMQSLLLLEMEGLVATVPGGYQRL
ncbi:DNA-processing protein DprA [Marinobacter nanhaiticus D15-8W]|uniref:DNA-protecting protein DprA n=1 Tax=Marinobacter nanhaiticus D15-8W TaxID=626887 RepID=N6W531_9GAMM|nr:DNA-processing protein DprA [Marinobacter nanhaiticus]ENO15299.1 DNA-protecting protein DprA [Marinobacter nanhaiticus D15-8W]BES68998.1 DNA-processing protein DprA [Marinobacter nanhaiticus D15-8W]